MKSLIIFCAGFLILSGCERESREDMIKRLTGEFKNVVKRRFHEQNLPGHDAMSSYQTAYDIDPTDEAKRRISRVPKKPKPGQERFDLFVYDEGKDFEVIDNSNPWKPIKARVRYLRQHWSFDVISNWFKPDSVYTVEEEWSYYRGDCKRVKTIKADGSRPWDREVERSTPPEYEKKIKDLNYGIEKEPPAGAPATPPEQGNK